MAKKKSKNPPTRGALHDRLRTRVHGDKKKKERDRPTKEEAREMTGKTGRRRDSSGRAEMRKTDPRIDAYIAGSADFARPILEHLRALVHRGCPEVEETIKWGTPHFEHDGMLCSMAAFKGHCAFGFWNGALIIPGNREAMGQFGRITALSDLPSDKTIIGYVKEATRLNESGVKRPPRPRRERKRLVVPADLRSALQKSPAARSIFESFSPSHRREYIEWITEAKREDTRARRLKTAIDWMAEGKSRNWKYMRSRPWVSEAG